MTETILIRAKALAQQSHACGVEAHRILDQLSACLGRFMNDPPNFRPLRKLEQEALAERLFAANQAAASTARDLVAFIEQNAGTYPELDAMLPGFRDTHDKAVDIAKRSFSLDPNFLMKDVR